MIKDSDKKEEYEKLVVRIVRSLYPNKADCPDEEIIKIVKTFRNYLLENAVKIFKENKIVYVDLNKTPHSEYWKVKDISGYDEYYENFIYKAISLFVIKKLDAKRNPASLIDYIGDSYNFSPILRYFSYADIMRAYY
jgi:hypothetical protein